MASCTQQNTNNDRDQQSNNDDCETNMAQGGATTMYNITFQGHHHGQNILLQ